MVLDDILQAPESWGDYPMVEYADRFHEQIAKLNQKIQDYRTNRNMYGEEVALFYAKGRWEGMF